MLYNYTADGRLEQIEETSELTIGFQSAAVNGIAQYQYDANGNMTQDDHKNITVDYNYLNLPTKVKRTNEGEILWRYDATGRKLSKEVLRDSLKIDDNPIGDGKYYANWITSMGNIDSGSDVQFIARDSIVLKPGFSAKDNFIAKIGANEGTIRNYVSGIEYFEGEMEAIYHEVGRVFFEENTQTYEFTIADHLGNTRVVFFDNGNSIAQVVQINDYYAFGLAFNEGQNKYRYTFGHKEEQYELGLEWSDFGARFLMRDVGRWGQVDPLAASFFYYSPYNYAFNNPLKYIDPTGMAPEKPDSRPELITPSHDLYGREGGSHTIGQSGVLDLNDTKGERRTFTTYLVNDTDSDSYGKLSKEAKPLTSSEIIKITQHIAAIYENSGIESGTFIFKLMKPEEAKDMSVLTTDNSLFIALVNDAQSRYYHQVGNSVMIGSARTEVWATVHWASYAN